MKPEAGRAFQDLGLHWPHSWLMTGGCLGLTCPTGSGWVGEGGCPVLPQHTASGRSLLQRAGGRRWLGGGPAAPFWRLDGP